MKFTLSLTHRCNLACKYCYGGEKFSRDMSPSTVKKAIDFAFETAGKNSEVEFNFFGGEPLLRFDLIEKAISYIRNHEGKLENPVSFSITTNGTLINDYIISVVDRENINLCISLDGTENVHNLNRCYKNGRGSFDNVLSNLRKSIENLNYVQVNSVYGPETID